MGMGMDWYSWLAKTGLAPAVTYEYGLLFNQNELERGDAAHFDHDLLKSMGIAVAKHRLEILKLARKDAGSAGAGGDESSSYARLVRKAGRCIARCARRLARGGSGGGGGGRGASVTVVPRICSSGDDAVRVGAVQRRRRSVKKMVLMITDGAAVAGARGCGRFSGSQKASLMFHDCYEDENEEQCGSGAAGEEEEERCSDGGAGGCDDEIKWDSMFQDLKPT
ncbi:hypothetical protein GUJ93_ZPchr0006g43554 [Zizania palustris]|uniref:SAM domain-containing protein n=1 Tax=Zizania palustris TaxID=103762 RepID=A0A8J5SFS8_ZIZPA|nr:hypothetical protein GUJ93_ZPchr0006g43554 [Zizania palustris]